MANPASALLGGGKKRKKKPSGNAGGALLGPNFFKKASGEFGSRNVTFSQNASGEFAATPNASGVGGAGVATRAAGLVDPVADQQARAKKADTAIPLSVAHQQSNVAMTKNIMGGLVGGAKAVGDLFGGFAKDAMNLGDLAGGALDTLGLAATNAALPTIEQIRMAGQHGTGDMAGVPDVEAGPKTYQEQLDQLYVGTGKTAPKATEDQELRFAQRRAETLQVQARRAMTGGGITMQGPRGKRVEISASEIGTKAGTEKAQKAGRNVTEGGVVMKGGTIETNILVNGRKFKIPGHLNQEQFEDQVEGYRTVGLSYKEATAEALADSRKVWGDEREPAGIELAAAGRLGQIRAGTEKGAGFAEGFGSPEAPATGNVPLDFVLNERRREAAADEARRTGIIQTLPPRAGSGPLELAQQISQGPRGISPDMTEAQKVAIRLANATRPRSVTVGTRIAMRAAAAVKAEAFKAAKLAGTRAEAKAIKMQGKVMAKFLQTPSGRVQFGTINKWMKNFVEGETYQEGTGTDKETKHLPGKGSIVPGRKFEAGVLQRGKPTSETIGKIWTTMNARFGKHVSPAVLAYALDGFLTESEWDQSMIHDFYRKHKDVFHAQLAVPATPENTGGSLLGSTKDFTKEDIPESTEFESDLPKPSKWGEPITRETAQAYLDHYGDKRAARNAAATDGWKF